MAATLTFDVTAFRASFPAFSNSTTFPTNTLQMYWDMATSYVSNQNVGTLVDSGRQLAINLMTAHLTQISVLVASGQTPGQVQSATVDKVSVSVTPPPNPNQWQWWLGLTPYGQQLLALLQVNSVGGFFYGGRPETAAFRKVFGCF